MVEAVDLLIDVRLQMLGKCAVIYVPFRPLLRQLKKFSQALVLATPLTYRPSMWLTQRWM